MVIKKFIHKANGYGIQIDFLWLLNWNYFGQL
jgi:hypothetical protein